ncbi:MAG: hypothetical protein RRZ84_09040 [Romboutsia sp.]
MEKIKFKQNKYKSFIAVKFAISMTLASIILSGLFFAFNKL